MATEGIPTIDVSHFIGGTSDLKGAVIQQWNRAFSEYGFCIITGHGVDEKLIDNLYTKALAFFRLSKVDKMKFYLGKGYGYGGYVPRGIEMVNRSVEKEASEQPDLVENISFTMNTVAIHTDVNLDEIVPNFMNAMQDYFSILQKLTLQLMKLSALALNLDLNYFMPSYENQELALRLAYYPKTVLTETSASAMRYGAHTDYGGFTILKTDDYLRVGKCHSLEVEFNGTWLPIVSPQNGLIINAGDLIQRWTNGKWKSATHRVVNSNLDIERLSMVSFTSPHKDTIVDPVPGTFSDEADKLYGPISASQYVRDKLDRTTVKK